MPEENSKPGRHVAEPTLETILKEESAERAWRWSAYLFSTKPGHRA